MPQLLLSEDDPAMQRLVTKWATGAGYEVSCVRNGRDAMTMIESSCPHIVLTSRDIPVVNGLELARWIRGQQLPRYVYTIICTSRFATSEIMRCLEVGADDVLRKPLDRGDLFMRLTAGLRVGQLEKRLVDAAQVDCLTGLASQPKFFERLHGEWMRAQRYSLPLSCVVLDIDQFLSINNAHGHAVGDVVIRTIAETLKENTRETDFIGRHSGEEFCVLLTETNESQAISWAERVRKTLARRNMVVRERPLSFTVSFGVAQLDHEAASPAELIQGCQQALRVAKRSGRNCVVGYSSTHGINTQHCGRIDASLSAMTCSALMVELGSLLRSDDPISEAVRYLVDRNVDLAPVVDLAGEWAGVVKSTDAMTAMLDASWRERPLAEFVQAKSPSFDERTPAAEVYEFLSHVPISAVVVTRDTRPVGVISRGDVVRWYVNSLAGANKPWAAVGPSCQADDGEASRPPQILDHTMKAVERELQRLRGRDEPPRETEIVGGVARMQQLLAEMLSQAAHGRRAEEQQLSKVE